MFNTYNMGVGMSIVVPAAQVQTALAQPRQSVLRRLPLRGAGRQIEDALHRAIAQRAHRRVQRRHGLADARRRLRDQPAVVGQRKVGVLHQPPLPGAIVVKGKGQRLRRIPRPVARVHLPNLKRGIGLRQSEKRLLQLLRSHAPGHLHRVAAAHVHQTHAGRRRALAMGHDGRVHDGLHPVHLHAREVRRQLALGGLDLLDHGPPFIRAQPVDAPLHRQPQAVHRLGSGHGHLASPPLGIRLLQSHMRLCALAHPAQRPPGRDQIAAQAGELHQRADVDARLPHKNASLRENSAVSLDTIVQR